MDQKSAWEFILSIWSGIDPDNVTCSHCGRKIETNEVLSRTFSLESWGILTAKQYVEKIPSPSLGDAMVIYHRHLACLLQATKYVAISHVWHPQVADLQYRKLEANSSANDVEQILRELPAHIARGVATGLNLAGKIEIWHDYISVPQWTPELKGQIIQSIPEIFNRAITTVAYLSDVDTRSVVSMRKGCSVDERCRGMTDICNSTWFSRIWTAMELTQSRELRVMLKDFTLLEEDPVHGFFMDELLHRWGAEVQSYGNHIVEERAARGDNLIPWQLGPLPGCRGRYLRGMKTPFGSAYQLLSRRRVTVEWDFFYALLGILKPQVTAAQLSRNPQEAMRQVIISCLKAGDFSPLFMIPASTQADATAAHIQSYGFSDVGTFAIDDDYDLPESPPTFPEVKFNSRHPTICTECLGTVRLIKIVKWATEGAAKSFAILLRLAIDTVGWFDIEELVTTLGVRLYAQERHKIFQRLSEKGRMQLLHQQIRTFYDTFSDDSAGIAAEIAGSLGLSDRAALGGGYHRSRFCPMEFLDGHGATMHLGNAGAVVGIACLHCHKIFLLRVALLAPPSELVGVRAYRVPGLRYKFTHLGGCGFLLKDSHIVGRFIWGSPTCDCPKLEDVEVALEEPPMPRPNNFQYGQVAQPQSRKLFLEERVKWIGGANSQLPLYTAGYSNGGSHKK